MHARVSDTSRCRTILIGIKQRTSESALLPPAGADDLHGANRPVKRTSDGFIVRESEVDFSRPDGAVEGDGALQSTAVRVLELDVIAREPRARCRRGPGEGQGVSVDVERRDKPHAIGGERLDVSTGGGHLEIKRRW